MALKAPAAAPRPAPSSPPAAPASFSLPVLVSSPADVGRLLRELEMIDNSLLQLGLRASGTPVKMPATSQLMDELLATNKLNLLQPAERAALQKNLQHIRDKAPVLHISFSADPTTAFLEKLMVWLRRELHPQVLLTVGLQPTIGAGCIMRSTNKYFDLSLRQSFAKKHDLLLAKLAEVTQPKVPAP